MLQNLFFCFLEGPFPELDKTWFSKQYSSTVHPNLKALSLHAVYGLCNEDGNKNVQNM
jgi:hypothetical protein